MNANNFSQQYSRRLKVNQKVSNAKRYRDAVDRRGNVVKSVAIVIPTSIDNDYYYSKHRREKAQRALLKKIRGHMEPVPYIFYDSQTTIHSNTQLSI